MSQDIQANSFPCRECGVIFSEESGASKGFLCDNCTADIECGLKFRIEIKTTGITYDNALLKLSKICNYIERNKHFKVNGIKERTLI